MAEPNTANKECATLDPKSEALLAAFAQSWEETRHAEKSRMQYSNLYWLAVGAALALALQHKDGFLEGLEKYWVLFLFLGVISILTSFLVVKCNEEIKNHVAGIQWIAEEIALIRPAASTDDPRIMFTGYMALPLPLGVRVINIFKRLMYLGTLGTSWAAVTGLFLHPGLHHEDSGRAARIGFLAGLAIVLLVRIFVRNLECDTKTILAGRKPEHLKIEYPD